MTATCGKVLVECSANDIDLFVTKYGCLGAALRSDGWLLTPEQRERLRGLTRRIFAHENEIVAHLKNNRPANHSGHLQTAA